MMNKRKQSIPIPWRSVCLLLLVALSVQGCLGIGGSSNNGNFKQVSTGNNHSLGVNTSDQALFKGHIYFTQNRHLFVIDGSRNIKQLTSTGDVRDPAISPNGKWIAYVSRYYDYSDLEVMPTSGGSSKMLVNGFGVFEPNGNYAPKATQHWVAQPAWTPNSQSLIFLSDLQKLYYWANFPYGDLGNDFDNSPFLDLEVFSTTLNNPPSNTYIENNNLVALASYGDGGDRDPSYRPGKNHPAQIIYTHYTYDTSRTKQLIQIYMEDPNAIKDNPQMHYHPGDPGQEYGPGIPITPASTTTANMMPAFSPDGNHVAYIRRIDTNHMGLYIMPTPSSSITANPNNASVQKEALQAYAKSQLLVEGEFVSYPVWSPDGSQLAYVYYSNGEFDIWLANLSYNSKSNSYSVKGSVIPLTSGGIDADSHPAWAK
jgi:hypothetical protein